MSTDQPSDEFGRPLSDAVNRMDRHEERRAARSHGGNPWSRWAERINRRIEAHSASVKNLATATGMEFSDVRRDFERRIAAERDARIELERQIESLRGQLDVARQLDDVQQRLDRLETPPAERGADTPSPRQGLRLAGQSMIA